LYSADRDEPPTAVYSEGDPASEVMKARRRPGRPKTKQGSQNLTKSKRNLDKTGRRAEFAGGRLALTVIQRNTPMGNRDFKEKEGGGWRRGKSWKEN